MELGYIDSAGRHACGHEHASRATAAGTSSCIISTGSQGETHVRALPHGVFRATSRWTSSAGDRVIISATAIPGNEKTISRGHRRAVRQGRGGHLRARCTDLHVSGHACQEELKMMLRADQARSSSSPCTASAACSTSTRRHDRGYGSWTAEEHHHRRESAGSLR